MIRTGLTASLAAIAVIIAAWGWLAQSLPADTAQVPVHWGMSGAPDHFKTRGEALLMFGLLPGIAALLAVLMSVIPALDPMRPNVQRSSRLFLVGWIGAEAMIALAAIGVAIMTVRSAGGVDASSSKAFVRFMIAGVGLLLIFLGDAMPKTRPNFFVGVRTPWTLTSDLSWEKSNRLAGRFFVLIGFWGVISAFLLNGIQLAFAIVIPVIISVIITTVYSFTVWRNDPNRRQPPAQD